jgi:Holliday junction resolvasome RuvABC endonuclease subunit
VRREVPPPRVLAIDPTSRGFGFAVLEGAGSLVDWGVRTVAGNHHTVAVSKLRELIGLYRPDVLVVEDCIAPCSRRRRRVRTLLDQVTEMANGASLHMHSVSVREVHELFAPNVRANKHTIASAVAEHFPALASRLPPKRKIYMSEAERMAIFDATAFGLTYYFLTDANTRR